MHSSKNSIAQESIVHQKAVHKQAAAELVLSPYCLRLELNNAEESAHNRPDLQKTHFSSAKRERESEYGENRVLCSSTPNSEGNPWKKRPSGRILFIAVFLTAPFILFCVMLFYYFYIEENT